MITREQIKNDDRFYIDDWNLERITNRPVISYEIVEIPVGKVRRYYKDRIMPLTETDVYKYMDGSKESAEQYDRYCGECVGNANRGKAQFDELIDSFDGDSYDLKKGAIFVNQLNIIVEGQHRCCVLLKKYGKDYKIKVVRMKYKGLYLKTRLKILLAGM